MDESAPAIDPNVINDAAALSGSLLEKTELFLEPESSETQQAAQALRQFLKCFGDWAQPFSPRPSNDADGAGDDLVVEGFDKEQIWEQLEVQNLPLRRALRHRIAKLSKAPRGAVEIKVAADAEPGEASAADGKAKQKTTKGKAAKRASHAGGDSDASGAEEGSTAASGTDAPGAAVPGEAAGASSADPVPDDSFSWDEMYKFADLADSGKMRLEDDAGESDFDLLEADDLGDEDDGKDVMYADFFGPPSAQRGGSTSSKAGMAPRASEKMAPKKKKLKNWELAEAEAEADEDDEELPQEDSEDEEEEEEGGGTEGLNADDLSEEEAELEKQLKELQRGGGDDEGEEEEEEDDDGEDAGRGKGKKKAGDDDEEDGEADDDDEEEDEGEVKVRQASLYEMDKRLRSLEDEVAKLEDEQMEESTWSMKGEVSARQRPLNSLLEVHLDQPMSQFAARRAEDAVSTAFGGEGEGEGDDAEDDTAADLAAQVKKFAVDAVIKQRVWDEIFDDVVRRNIVPPSQRPQGKDDDAAETLNFQKSRVGLGDVYAQQYEADLLGHQTEAEVKEDAEKTEAKELFTKIMYKLDLLTNAHFTPRPPSLGMTGSQLSKVPSIRMEETIPLIMSQTSVKAPEELRAPRRHERNQQELDHEERAAVRRASKTKRKKALEQKLEEGTMSLKGVRDREQRLKEKNNEVKQRLAQKGAIKEDKKRIRASELLAQAAETVTSGANRKEEQRRERQAKPENAPSSKRLKL
mmetsp:Transcript_80914/g.177563  ORF Transcript_80914/g.177563 Transcript_80914/m.177563 type:complete len:750 (+) Transcript_80914:101-2350(+)|eukprot:CAMPEP_0206444380 /NCGR_PEP_ID=MMETSP0324_2-20121206/14879_1 /ASSEMBLY_ACC=CAM_ASM_000836 /TAXON_ID=2866 /ORGANISM="Crypthecodinium cohnii, Strain Seligo" /LENGTH=749 /DNA_ID=CAMNT_0053912395 /DNA_START=24 /DNA_END=2273 /DNA_ORIENTATION=-